MTKQVVKAPRIISVDRVLQSNKIGTWKVSWLADAVASRLGVGEYAHMSLEERKAAGYPVDRQEMIDYLLKTGEYTL